MRSSTQSFWKWAFGIVIILALPIFGGWIELTSRMTATEVRCEGNVRTDIENHKRLYDKVESIEARIAELQQTTARVETRVELLLKTLGEDHAKSSDSESGLGADVAGGAAGVVRVPDPN